jgi:AcrR family transcriptional regulator
MGSRQFDRAPKRQLLMESAAEVFATQGFASTRVADIAQHAGVAKGTVYEYFSSKEELFFAVFEWINQQIRRRVDRVLEGDGDPRRQLITLLRTSAEIVAEQRELFSMNLDFWAASRGSAFEDRFTTICRSQYQEYRRLAAEVIRRGQRDGTFRSQLDADRVATLVVSALDGLGVQCWFDASIDAVRAVDAFADALCLGLCQEDG